MAKTVVNVKTGERKRVSNVQAFKEVNSGIWAYCPKREEKK